MTVRSTIWVSPKYKYFQQGQRKKACELLQPVVAKHEKGLYLLSCFCTLAAFMAGNYRNGIESCTLATTLFKKKMLLDEDNVEEEFNEVLYLTLGRAYLAGGKKKKDAVVILHKGSQLDKQNSELLAEVKKESGSEKRFPFLFLMAQTRSMHCSAGCSARTRSTRSKKADMVCVCILSK